MGRRYVLGNFASDTSTTALVVVTPTLQGWRARSTARHYNHDYVSHETFTDVMAWIDRDMSRAYLTQDREDIASLIVKRSDSEHSLGFLYPGECSCVREEVDEALRHLERGW